MYLSIRLLLSELKWLAISSVPTCVIALSGKNVDLTILLISGSLYLAFHVSQRYFYADDKDDKNMNGQGDKANYRWLWYALAAFTCWLFPISMLTQYQGILFVILVCVLLVTILMAIFYRDFPGKNMPAVAYFILKLFIFGLPLVFSAIACDSVMAYLCTITFASLLVSYALIEKIEYGLAVLLPFNVSFQVVRIFSGILIVVGILAAVLTTFILQPHFAIGYLGCIVTWIYAASMVFFSNEQLDRARLALQLSFAAVVLGIVFKVLEII